MQPTLYFLRSSEQRIVTRILPYAKRLDQLGKRLEDLPELAKYERFYGLTDKDLGLYALDGHELAGAAWIRLLKESDHSAAFIDEKSPVLTIGVKPEFRGRGIGKAMLAQLLEEAGALYQRISVSVLAGSPAVSFYESFGFETVEGSQKPSPLDGEEVITMVKALSQTEVQRPTDGYDPTRWMD